MSILIFFAVLFVLILVHEWGHFIVAKKTGMRVDEFAIGFPPKIVGIKKGETEYTFNAIPIGGFVRIFGENPDSVSESEKDSSRAFNARPKWAQSLVLVAGVTMNIIFAWFLFVATLLIGVPTAIDESLATADSKLYITNVLPEGPLSGLIPTQSEIVKATAGENLLDNPTPTTFTQFIQANADSEISIHYKFGDQESVVSVKPEVGLIASAMDKPAVGVALALVENKSYSFGESLIVATKTTYEGLVNITIGLFALIAQSVQGTADFSQIAGPIGIVGMVGDAATFGLTSLLTFTAMISLNLAVINMLPVPALDGGRLLFVFIEAIIRRPINPIWMGRVNLVGFALLMLLMIMVTWSDISKLL